MNAKDAFKSSQNYTKIAVESSRLRPNERAWDEEGVPERRWAADKPPDLNSMYLNLLNEKRLNTAGGNQSGSQTQRDLRGKTPAAHQAHDGSHTQRDDHHHHHHHHHHPHADQRSESRGSRGSRASGSQTERGPGRGDSRLNKTNLMTLNNEIDSMIRPQTGMTQKTDPDRFGFNGGFLTDPTSLTRPWVNWREKYTAPLEKWQPRPRTAAEQGMNLSKKIPGYTGFYAGKSCRDSKTSVTHETPAELQYQLDCLARYQRRGSALPNDPTPEHGYQHDLHPYIAPQPDNLKKTHNMKKNQYTKWTEVNLLCGAVMQRGIKLKDPDANKYK